MTASTPSQIKTSEITPRNGDVRTTRSDARPSPNPDSTAIPTVKAIRTDGRGQLPEGSVGIAAAYAGDADIESDRDVVFADSFESYSEVKELEAKWSSVGQTGFVDLSGDVPDDVPGSKSLEMRIPMRNESLSNGVSKTLGRKQDILFVRYYI